MGRETTAAILVLCALLVGAVIAVAVLAVQLRDAKNEAADSDEQEELDVGTCDDVAIIGAGITGSYAAWRLRERGWKITLYEYSNRIGGRLHTVKLPGIPDVNVELGAMRFKPNEHPVLNQTVHDLGLDVSDFALGYGASGETLYYLRGEHMTYSELPTKAPYKIPEEYRYDFDTFLWHLFENYTKKDSAIDDPFTAYNSQRIKSIDDVDLGMQSRRAYDAKFLDSETVKYYSEANSFRSESDLLSAANWLPASDPNQPSGPNPVKTVTQGFQAVPKTMVDQFLASSKRHSFQRNHHLKSINKDRNGIYDLSFLPTETLAGETKEQMNGPRRSICAKKVVLAISRMALQHLDWSVLKYGEIRDMLDNSVEDVKAAKIYFGYDSPWWRNLSLASPYAISNTPLRQTYDFAKSKSSDNAVLNPSYTDVNSAFWRDVQKADAPVQGAVGGDMSIAMSNTSVYLARKFYAEIFNVTMNDVPVPNSAVMAIWDSYPFGAAWYDWSPGYIWEDVERKMMKPSQDDEVYTVGNNFSGAKLSDWSEGGLQIVDKLISQI